MPIARFQLPDGRVARFEVPDGTTPEQATQMMSAHFAQAPTAAPPIDVDPTKGVSGLENFMAGAGKAVADLGSGIQQLGAHAGNSLGLVSDNTVQGIDQGITETKARDAALMNTGAGLAGNVAGNVATILLPAGGVVRGAEAINAGRGALAARAFLNPATAGEAIGSGIVQGSLQPVAAGESRATNAALGGVGGGVGQGVVRAAGAIAQPIANALTPELRRSVQTLLDAGIPLDAAQQSGNPLLNRIRSSLSDNPFTMGAQATRNAAQGAGFNRAALNTFGAGAPAATSDVMRAADERIGGVFGDVLSRNNVTLGDNALTRLGAIQQSANDEGRPAASNVINRLLDAIGPDGTIPGQVAYNLRKDLVRIGKDPNEGFHARQAGSALMDAINGSLPAADQEAFTQARGQFRNMAIVEDAISKDGLGTVSPTNLSNVLGRKANRDASRYGRGDQELVDLADAGRQLLVDKTPNSGTAARLAMQFAPGVLAGGASYVHDGDWKKAAALAGGTYAAPKLFQFLLNNPAAANYLVNGLQPGAARTALEAPQANQLLRAIFGAGASSIPIGIANR